jgi:hypothetical protein
VTEHIGDAAVTLPRAARELRTKCDIAVVDGDHKTIPVFQDVVNFKMMSHNNTLLILDDTNVSSSWGKEIMEVVNTMEKMQLIKSTFMCNRPASVRGFAAFLYT